MKIYRRCILNTMDYVDAFNIGSIQLEPRLQEYMRRKRFNEENEIIPNIPEEKEFCITDYDVKIMKRYKQGKTNLYTAKRLAKDPHFIKANTDSFENFESPDGFDTDFKKDPRYARLQKKMQSHKDAQKQIRNFEGIDEDYEIFHRSNPYDLKPERRPSRIAKPYDDPSNNDIDNEDYNGSRNWTSDAVMMDSRDLVLAPSRPVRKSNHPKNRGQEQEQEQGFNFANENRGKYCYSPNERSSNPITYNHPPKIAYHQRLSIDREQVNGGLPHSRDVSDVIGNLDTYNKHLNDTYEYVQSDMDLDTRNYTPGMRTNTRRETPCSYQSIPFAYGNGLPNVCLEDSLRGGIRDSSKKSIGFQNPFEHQFDYISGDISDYKHTVQMWPQNSRGQNKEIARPNSIAVQSEKRLRAADRRTAPPYKIKKD
jgi:hypothetical protein